jgi:molybdate transport system ATP-binding protein
VLAPDGRLFRVRPADAATLSTAAQAPAAAAVFRPSAVVVQTERPQHASPRNVWAATITGIEPGSGGVRLRTSGNPQIIAEVTAASVAELGLQVGGAVWLSVKATEVSAHRR